MIIFGNSMYIGGGEGVINLINEACKTYFCLVKNLKKSLISFLQRIKRLFLMMSPCWLKIIISYKISQVVKILELATNIANRHFLKTTFSSSGHPKQIFLPKTQNRFCTISLLFLNHLYVRTYNRKCYGAEINKWKK